jgi:phage replisome organizer, putative, N-terminal region
MLRGMKYMRERKYVKFRVDMYEDTKFKIIDMKPERDVIHYVWNRIVLLAGKVNLEGELYLSKSIPYTIETLAIEFNRDIAEIKLALEVFIELQMIELTEDKIYKVKNFAKHQNIKVKEKQTPKNNDSDVKNIEVRLDKSLDIDKDKKSDNIESENIAEKLDIAKAENQEITNKDVPIADDCAEDKGGIGNFQKDNSIFLGIKKTRKRNKKKKDNLIDINMAAAEIMDEEEIDDSTDGFLDGDLTLGADEKVISQWSFG